MSWLVAIKEGFVSFLGVVAVWIGISVAAIKLLDWALSEPQKKKIADRLMVFWSWLDDNRRFVPLRKFQRSSTQMRVSAVLTLVFCFGVWMTYLGGTIEKPFFIFFELGALFALVAIGYLQSWIEWMASEENVLVYAIRSTLAFSVMVVLPLIVLFSLVIAGTLAQVGFGADVSILNFPLYLLFAFGSAFVTLQIYFWGTTIVYTLTIVILLIIGPALRFILVRTIEYPNGPVAAISALLTFLGAIAAKVGGAG